MIVASLLKKINQNKLKEVTEILRVPFGLFKTFLQIHFQDYKKKKIQR